MDTTRINLVVDADIPDMLTALAGGERKRGMWLSALIRKMYAAGYTPDTREVMQQMMELTRRIEKLERGR